MGIINTVLLYPSYEVNIREIRFKEKNLKKKKRKNTKKKQR